MCLGVPGEIVEILNEQDVKRSGRVRFGGVTRDVNLSCVPEAGVGDYVIVHAGFALSQVNESEAKQVFRYLRQIDAVKSAVGAEEE